MRASSIKTGPGRRRRLGRERGLRCPGARRRRVGLRGQPRPDDRRGGPRRRRGRPDRPRSATALREPVVLADRPPATGRYETPVEEDPFTVPLETQDRRPPGRRPGRDQGQGHRLHRIDVRRPARVEDLRRHRWQLHRAGHHPRRARRSRRTRSTATSTSAAPTRIRAAAGTPAGYEFIRGLGLAEQAEPLAEEAVELLTAPQCPSGRFTIILDPSQLYLQVHESCGHPTELDRVFGTEASYAGHELPDHGQARRGLPLRLRPHRHRRRRDRARRDGHLRLGRRGRRGAGRAARQGRASSSAT